MKTTTYRGIEVRLDRNEYSGKWGAIFTLPNDEKRTYTGEVGSRREARNEAFRQINVALETENAQNAVARYDAAGGQEKYVENANREYYLQKADEYSRLGQDEKAGYYKRMADEHLPDTITQLRTEPAFRKGFKEGLKSGYERHHEAGGTLPFLEWVLEVFGPEVWNELFQAKHSSHVVSLNGLTRADGRRVTRGY